MSLAFAIEPLEKCWRDIYDKPEGLAFKHWNETQGFRHYQGYAPSFDRYNQFAKIGWFLQFTARDEGKLVGYSGVYIVSSMHSGKTIASEDTWFLLKEYRRGWNAIKFYRFIENECVSRGAIEASLSLPTDRNIDPVVKRLGYTCRARQYSKSLVRADSPPTAEKSARKVCVADPETIA